MGIRVAITGVGCACALGVGASVVREAWRSGSQGLATSSSPRLAELAGGPVGAVDLPRSAYKNYFDPRQLRSSTMTRATLLTVVAAGDALASAGYGDGTIYDNAGCYVGYFIPGPDFVRATRTAATLTAPGRGRFAFDDARLADGLKTQSAFDFLKNLPNMPGAHVGIRADFLGPSNTYLGTQVSGSQALHAAVQDIASGDADIMIAGGVGAPLEELYLAWERQCGRLPQAGDAASPRILGASAGSHPAEAAAFVVLESAARVAERGLRPLAWITGGAVRHAATPAQAVQVRLDALSTALGDSASPALIVPSLRGVAAEERLEVEAWQALLGAGMAEVPCIVPSLTMGDSSAAEGPLGLLTALWALSDGRVPAPSAPHEAGPFRSAPAEIGVGAALISSSSPEGGYAALCVELPA